MTGRRMAGVLLRKISLSCDKALSASVAKARCIALGLACLLSLAAAPTTMGQTLVLVSIDGFRHDYLSRYAPPRMLEMAMEGFVVDRLTPVYPPNTFPGHLSLITGLRPEQHGIEDNHFCHAERGDCYHMGGGKTDPSWLHGVPLWNWVELNGGIAATYFWPESDALWGGKAPTYHLPYSKAAPYAERVEQVLTWLQLPAPVRPNLVTLYFSAVDTAGHRFGPHSSEVAAAVAEIDTLLGRLWSGLQALDDSPINLLLVSDHGMSELTGDHAVLPEDLPPAAGFEIMRSHARVRYYPETTDADVGRLLDDLQQADDPRYRILTAEQALQEGGTTPNTVPALTLVAEAPTFFARSSVPAEAVFGGHGYSADHPDMGAFALGVGPAFRKTRVEVAHQLAIFPLALSVLGYPPPPGLAPDAGKLNRVLQAP